MKREKKINSIYLMTRERDEKDAGKGSCGNGRVGDVEYLLRLIDYQRRIKANLNPNSDGAGGDEVMVEDKFIKESFLSGKQKKDLFFDGECGGEGEEAMKEDVARSSDARREKTGALLV